MLHSPGNTKESAEVPPTGKPAQYENDSRAMASGPPWHFCPRCGVSFPSGAVHSCSGRPCTDGVTPEELGPYAESGHGSPGSTGHVCTEECRRDNSAVDVGDEAIRQIRENLGAVMIEDPVAEVASRVIWGQLSRLEAYLSGLRAR